MLESSQNCTDRSIHHVFRSFSVIVYDTLLTHVLLRFYFRSNENPSLLIGKSHLSTGNTSLSVWESPISAGSDGSPVWRRFPSKNEIVKPTVTYFRSRNEISNRKWHFSVIRSLPIEECFDITKTGSDGFSSRKWNYYCYYYFSDYSSVIAALSLLARKKKHRFDSIYFPYSVTYISFDRAIFSQQKEVRVGQTIERVSLVASSRLPVHSTPPPPPPSAASVTVVHRSANDKRANCDSRSRLGPTETSNRTELNVIYLNVISHRHRWVVTISPARLAFSTLINFSRQWPHRVSVMAMAVGR